MPSPIRVEEALADFVAMFELVFDNDWSHTKAAIDDPPGHLVALSGTFIRPGVDDESNNWCNRASLLDAYRELLAAMREANFGTSGLGYADERDAAPSLPE